LSPVTFSSSPSAPKKRKKREKKKKEEIDEHRLGSMPRGDPGIVEARTLVVNDRVVYAIAPVACSSGAMIITPRAGSAKHADGRPCSPPSASKS